ncbi:hypothetical protein J2Z49_000805 [Desulfofundulus luciae]|uniref:Capsule synthesis protein CapA domain-containing protein n=1 Tax=Desulfofundulus luciae TaxID=74702 RepID=A0ABU0AZ07_9FIRM|nr:CapA family protein [Desulfofundulus luciae]MDQ0285701.1 hypothetical protein [Desulfofundulus luciae]
MAVNNAIKILIIFFSILILPGISLAESEITIKLNNRVVFSDAAPFIEGGRVLVPLQVIGEAAGAEVKWNGQRATLTKEQITIEVIPGSKVIWAGGRVFCLDVPARMKNGRLFVPLRFISEFLGGEVKFQNKTVEIKYPASQEQEITLNFAGDTTLAWFFEEFVKDNFDYPFALFPSFKQADITMLNLENPVTTRGKKVPKQFNFRMNPKYIQVLLKGGVDIVNLANNHVGDYGPQGILDTLNFLDAAGIKHVGAGENLKAARNPVIFSLKQKKIGFLGYFGGKDYAATTSKPGTSPCYEQYIIEDIKKLKQKADVVVVNFHWGVERAHYPEPYQIRLAHQAIDAGADLIIGHHPHVLQGIERYKNGVIVYSLGNFIFGGNSRREHDTFVFQLIIKGEQKQYALIPVRVKNWQPYWLDSEEGEGVISSIQIYSKYFPDSLL